jgi:hypothetical protein
MWIIREPKKVALWNKRHFEEKIREYVACLKYSVLIFVEKIYIKYKIWRVAVRPSYIKDARFLKVNVQWCVIACKSESVCLCCHMNRESKLIFPSRYHYFVWADVQCTVWNMPQIRCLLFNVASVLEDVKVILLKKFSLRLVSRCDIFAGYSPVTSMNVVLLTLVFGSALTNSSIDFYVCRT